jgi:hypothetical protein
MTQRTREELWSTFLTWVLVMDFILFNEIFGGATLWWLHRAAEYWLMWGVR